MSVVPCPELYPGLGDRTHTHGPGTKAGFYPLQLKYKEKHVKERGSCHAVPDTPQILLAKTVSGLVSEVPTPLRPPPPARPQAHTLTGPLWVPAEQVQGLRQEALGPGLVHNTARDQGHHPCQGSDQARQRRKCPAAGPWYLRIRANPAQALGCKSFRVWHVALTTVGAAVSMEGPALQGLPRRRDGSSTA